MTIPGEDYEALCVAMAMIEVAQDALGVTDFFEEGAALNELYNELNDARLRCLGNGLGRPYHVAELVRAQETPHD